MSLPLNVVLVSQKACLRSLFLTRFAPPRSPCVAVQSGGQSQAMKQRKSGWLSIALLIVAFLFLLVGFYAGKLPASSGTPAAAGEL